MVGKLFKHEVISYLRILLPVEIALLVIAFFGRILQQFESDNVIYGILLSISFLVFMLAIAVALILTVIIGVIRFYKNLFTAEGYLTFTLPITSFQHIMIKALVASLSLLATSVTAILAVGLFIAGDVFHEVMNAIVYLMNYLWELCDIHLIFYVIEVLALLLVSLCGSYLVYYVCIAIGQLFRKYRILAAIGVYFVYYIVSQFMGNILMIIPVILETNESARKFLETHMLETIHAVLGGSVLLTAGFGVVCFVVTHLIIRNKLNLE